MAFPAKNMRWIYISPHFDDAVLSCGGLIWQQAKKGLPVEIWTICAGDAPPGQLSPLAVACHWQWGIESAKELVSTRNLENQASAAWVGADTVNFSIPDCIYRRSEAGELLYTGDVFVPPDPVEKSLQEDISAALASELLSDDVLVCPLAIGGHLDHLMTRHAVENLGRSPWYYADIPYLFNQPEMLAHAVKGLKKTLLPVSKAGLGAWQKGIAAYSSQIRMLFETREKMHKAIRNYWAERQGTLLWKARKA